MMSPRSCGVLLLLFITTDVCSFSVVSSPTNTASIISVLKAVPRSSPEPLAAVDTTGGPPRGPPGGGSPAGGGPPPPTLLQKILEGFLGVAFQLLYLGDSSGVVETSKNLRVLWTRAVLAHLGKIDDPIAYELLPTTTRGVAKAPIYGPFLDKLDFIVNRTNFIDGQVQEWLAESNGDVNRQVVILGAGYDTRALRYPNVQFYEVDLPNICKLKADLVQDYRGDDGESNIQHVPLDLNEILTCNKSLLEELSSQGFRPNSPTLVICEALLFYLIPSAVQKLMAEVFSLPSCRYCLTDSLSKVGITPGPPVPSPRTKCEAWLKTNDKELVAHDAIFGGAIHFVGAK